MECGETVKNGKAALERADCGLALLYTAVGRALVEQQEGVWFHEFRGPPPEPVVLLGT